MQKVSILDKSGAPVLDNRGREKFCYSMDAAKAIQIGSYVPVDSETRTIQRTGKDYTVILSIRPKTDEDKRKEAEARKIAAQAALEAAQATLDSDDILKLIPASKKSTETVVDTPQTDSTPDTVVPGVTTGPGESAQTVELTEAQKIQAKKDLRNKKLRDARAAEKEKSNKTSP